jgi:hypothetical protein
LRPAGCAGGAWYQRAPSVGKAAPTCNVAEDSAIARPIQKRKKELSSVFYKFNDCCSWLSLQWQQLSKRTAQALAQKLQRRIDTQDELRFQDHVHNF